MRRCLLVFTAVAVLGLAVSAGAQTPFVHGPYSGAPSATSVVISWVLSSPAEAQLEVAPADAESASETFPRIVDVPAAGPDSHGQIDVMVDNLEPATAYVYRVVIQSGTEAAASPVGRFKTAPAPGQTVTFAVVSDTQWQWEGVNRLAAIGDAIAFDSARSGGFDFILHAGDLVESPTDNDWNSWFGSFEPMLLAAPLLPVLGNHENNNASYYRAFAHPPGGGQNGERWWALHWGDVVVVGLDTNVTQAALILEQEAFARAELSGSERWKIVVFHQPLFSSDAYHGGNSTYAEAFHPIFVETGVKLVFSGHAHDYERIERDGVVYLVVGGGGAVPRELAATRVEGSLVAVENHNFYARVTASPDAISVDIVSVAVATDTSFVLTPAMLLDSFTIQAPRAAEVPAEPTLAAVQSPPETPVVSTATPAPQHTGLLTAALVATIALLAALARAFERNAC